MEATNEAVVVEASPVHGVALSEVEKELVVAALVAWGSVGGMASRLALRVSSDWKAANDALERERMRQVEVKRLAFDAALGHQAIYGGRVLMHNDPYVDEAFRESLLPEEARGQFARAMRKAVESIALSGHGPVRR